MNILIADKFDAAGLATLTDAGFAVDSKPDLTPDDLPDAVAEIDPAVLVVRSTKVRAPVFERGRALSLVVRAGAGYDTIDVAAASAAGVFVANCPGKNAAAVAELAWGLILACDRRIPDQTAELKSGLWNKKLYSKAPGLLGRTLGVIGVGRIGELVIHRAHAFGMPVVAWSRSLTPARAAQLGVERADTPRDVARRADVVSLHVAANPDTEHLVDAEFLDAMNDGATLINTTRGSVVDEAALAHAINAKGLRVGLDVYADEPGAADSTSDIAVAKLPGVVGTHHVGASTDQAQRAIADEAVRVITVYAQTGEVPNVVNRALRSKARWLVTVRHRNRPGVLAGVVGAIGRAGINIEEMENIIYDGAEAACARIRLDAPPDPETAQAIGDASPHIISSSVTTLD